MFPALNATRRPFFPDTVQCTFIDDVISYYKLSTFQQSRFNTRSWSLSVKQFAGVSVDPGLHYTKCGWQLRSSGRSTAVRTCVDCAVELHHKPKHSTNTTTANTNLVQIEEFLDVCFSVAKVRPCLVLTICSPFAWLTKSRERRPKVNRLDGW